MAIRTAVLVSALACLLLPACGGGGSDAYVAGAQNAPEKELTGSYRLYDFNIFEAGTPPCGPRDFDDWGGTLELRPDMTATVAMMFCEHEGTVTSQCERDFTWSADTGLIYLKSTESTERDVLVHWEATGMGGIRTESILPTNEPNCGLLIAGDGFEVLDWLRTE